MKYLPGASIIARLWAPVVAVLTLMLVATPFANAQTPVPPAEQLRTISVSGTGRVTASPDAADIYFGLESRNEELSVAQSDVSTNAETLTTMLTENGIADDDIQTVAYEIMPVNEYDEDGNFERVDHYLVSMAIKVTVRDIDQVGSLLDQGVTAGATFVGSISFYVDDPTPFMSQAREAAISDARTKADEYARHSGAIITGVFSIEETSAPMPAAQEYRMEDSAVAAEADAAQPVPVSPGTTEIIVMVDVVYSIESGNG